MRRLLPLIAATCALGLIGGPAMADETAPPPPLWGAPVSTETVPPQAIPPGPSIPRGPEPRPIKHELTPGPGSDRRPCVSDREYHGFDGMYENTDHTRVTVEARWEVTNRGELSDFGIRYKRCGYSLTESFVAVAYAEGIAYAVVRVRGLG